MKVCNKCGKTISDKKLKRHKYRCNKTKSLGEVNEYQYEQRLKRAKTKKHKRAVSQEQDTCLKDGTDKEKMEENI